MPACAQIVTNSQVNETYVLYQCGLSAPNNALLPLGAKVFSIPLTSVAVGDTVPLAFLVPPWLTRAHVHGYFLGYMSVCLSLQQWCTRQFAPPCCH